MDKLMKAALAIGLALPAPAPAHIVFDKEEGRAGDYYVGVLRVSHGCGASPTRSVRVEMPTAIVSARPQPKPGWTVRIETAPLQTPVAGEGGRRITERVVAIGWTGELPADQFEQFGIMLKLPATAGPLYFPTLQTCASGQTDWKAIPPSPDRWHDVEEPAPMLIVKAADAHAGHGM